MADKPIWKRTKFWMVVIGVAGVLAVALGGTAVGLDDEARRKATEAILWLVGLLMGTHTVTDVGSQVTGAMTAKAEADGYRAKADGYRAETERMEAKIVHGVLADEDDGAPEAPASEDPIGQPGDSDRVTPVETPRPRTTGEEADDER